MSDRVDIGFSLQPIRPLVEEVTMRASLILLLAGLSACSVLPRDGPSTRAVQAAAGEASAPCALVDLALRTAQIASAPEAPLSTLAPASSAALNDRIGPGDVLSVTIMSPGSGPLGLSGGGGQGGAGVEAPQRLDGVAVDADGRVQVPLAGLVRVGGLTAAEASEAVRRALRAKIVNPQVLVTVTANLANSVMVIGEVRASGRYPLSANNDRLLHMLAAAGGATRQPADVAVRVVRGDIAASAPLDVILASPQENIRLAPQDQVIVAYQPRKYSTFGAVLRAAEVPIEDSRLTLTRALSRVGGLDNNSANAAAVYVFRFERREVVQALGAPSAGGPTNPVVYRLNLREPQGLFIASRFEVRSEDLIFVPRADSAELGKFFGLVRTASQVAYDIRVARALD